MTPQPVENENLEELAFTKMARVLGAERARQLLRTMLNDLQLQLRTADDLATLAEHMAKLSGFEGAVGAMLGVAAVMRGAAPRPKRAS